MAQHRENRWIVKNFPKFRCKQAMAKVFNQKFNRSMTASGMRYRYRAHAPAVTTIDRYIRSREALPESENVTIFKAPSKLYQGFPYVAKIQIPKLESSLEILEAATRRGEIRMISKQDYLRAEKKHAKHKKSA